MGDFDLEEDVPGLAVKRRWAKVAAFALYFLVLLLAGLVRC